MNREIIFNTYYLDRMSVPAKYSFSLMTISDLKRAVAGLGAGEMVAKGHLRDSSKTGSPTFSMPSSLSLALVVPTFLETCRWKDGGSHHRTCLERKDSIHL